MKRMITDGGDTQYLPEEIIRNILKRLPVKSLIRFQCVCKHWKNPFKTSSFIADHLCHCHQNSFLLFECYGFCDPYEKCYPLHLCLVDRQLRVHKVQNAPRIPSRRVVRIVDSSNGLICVRLHGTTRSLLVYNIEIRGVKLVPEPLTHGDGKCYIGFGFSPIVNDYRIVRLCASFFEDLVYGVQVFSVSTSSWKEVEVGNLKGVTLLRVDGFTINGAIFWFGLKRGVAEEGENDRYLIVSFDIATEVFTLIPMPPIRINFDTNFNVYEDKLAVLYPTGNPISCFIELWVMEEGTSVAGEGQRWSWTKKYTSNPYPCRLRPRILWRNEIVCAVDAMPTLIREAEAGIENVEIETVLINLATNEFNKFVQRGFSPSHYIFNHVESLVPVDKIPNEEP